MCHSVLHPGESAGGLRGQASPTGRGGQTPTAAGPAATEGKRESEGTQQQRATSHDGHENKVRLERHLLG